MTQVYGLVNQGIQTFIVENFGQEDWEDVRRKADLQCEQFDSMLTYPDEVTYRLVGCISEKYAMRPEDVLTKFGDYWVGFSSASKLGRLMRFGGDTLIERLEDLNAMHARVKVTMPHLQPPSFEFETNEDGTHQLHYASEREGLEPMVVGLLEGLASETGDTIEISQDPEPKYQEFRASFTIKFVS